MKSGIRNLAHPELRAWLKDQGRPQYRADQISDWLYRRLAVDFGEMSNLPQPLRQALDRQFLALSVTCADRQEDAEGTAKYLLQLADGNHIESVLIRSGTRATVCVSTQVGCPVRCTLCASGRHGLVRDLDTAEIVDQVIFACRQLGRTVSNIVVMGMGEPLLNLRNTVKALDNLCAPEGLRLGARRITISTSGIPDGIKALADLGRQWHLALSLHAVSDEKRARLIPSGYRCALAEILAACALYKQRTGRIVTLEYALIHEFNDRPDDIQGLAAIARRLQAKVNLIPCNDAGTAYRPPSPPEVSAFAQGLRQRGIPVTVRRGKGARIQAACGQLRQKHAS